MKQIIKIKKEKKYKLKKNVFLDWLYEDNIDLKHFGKQILHLLKENGKVSFTIEEILLDQSYIPVHLLENSENIEMEDILDMDLIELID